MPASVAGADESVFYCKQEALELFSFLTIYNRAGVFRKQVVSNGAHCIHGTAEPALPFFTGPQTSHT